MFPKAFSGPPLFRLGGFAVANAGVTILREITYVEVGFSKKILPKE